MHSGKRIGSFLPTRVCTEVCTQSHRSCFILCRHCWLVTFEHSDEERLLGLFIPYTRHDDKQGEERRYSKSREEIGRMVGREEMIMEEKRFNAVFRELEGKEM